MSETIQLGGYTITIAIDTDVVNPREDYDHAGKMISWHNKYQLGDKHTWGVESFQAFKEAHPEHLYLPIYLYDHSGITISTGPFSCQWDSGQVGWIYIEASDIESEFGGDRQQAEKCLESEIKEYDDYIRGEVYGYTITKDGEDIDSCWGMYGFEYCKEAAVWAVETLLGIEEEPALYRNLHPPVM